MRFGACAGGFDRYKMSVDAGCDFVELNAWQLYRMPESEIAEGISLIREYGIKAEATNCLFPGEMVLSGSTCDFKIVDEYTNRMFTILSGLGIKVSVFGSGGARNIPQGEDENECMERLCKSAYITAENAKKNGMIVAVEPLRKCETNVINTVSEAAEFCKAVNHSSLMINPDLYHMASEDEPFENLARYIDKIAHIHIGDYNKREYPTYNDGCEYKKILGILQNAGYQGRVSIEAATSDYGSDCRRALEILRNSL